MFKFLIQLIFFCCISNISIAQENNSRLKISHLKGNFYIYTTWQNYNNTAFPANGMYMVTHDGVILIDTMLEAF